LKGENLGAYEQHLAYLDAPTLLEIITKYVNSGKLVDAQFLFSEGHYVKFGQNLGDFIKFSFKVAAENQEKQSFLKLWFLY